MNLYSRALRHIEMNRVKELREEKIKKEKIVAKIREEIREELRNLNSPEFSNWRCELEEGYAETPEAAEAIMVNMSEEWRQSILG